MFLSGKFLHSQFNQWCCYKYMVNQINQQMFSGKITFAPLKFLDFLNLSPDHSLFLTSPQLFETGNWTQCTTCKVVSERARDKKCATVAAAIANKVAIDNNHEREKARLVSIFLSRVIFQQLLKLWTLLHNLCHTCQYVTTLKKWLCSQFKMYCFYWG